MDRFTHCAGSTRMARFLGTVTLVVAADQITKTGSSRLSASALVLPVHNQGLSLELVDTGRWLESCAMAVGLLFAAILLIPRAASGRSSAAGVGMALGGAVSNLLDRVLLGSVRDFILLGPVVVNIADFAVLAGLLLILAGHGHPGHSGDRVTQATTAPANDEGR